MDWSSFVTGVFVGILLGVFTMAMIAICREPESFSDLDFYRIKEEQRRREADIK